MDLCKNCGYILTAADLNCPECGTPVGGLPQGFSAPTGPPKQFAPPPRVTRPPEEKKEDKKQVPPEQKEHKQEGEDEEEIVKPWAVKAPVRKKTVREDLSDSFTITKTEVKRKMQLGASQFWRENLKYIIMALSVIIIIYAVLTPYYRKERIQKDVEKKEYQEMLEDEDKESKNTKLLLKRADHFIEQKNFDKALRDMNKARDLEPKNAEIYHKLGSFYFKIKKDNENSIISYSKAIDLNPNESEYYVSRAITYEANDELQKALKDFDKYISLKPDSTVGYTGRAKVYRKITEYDKGIEDYLKAIELDPEDKTKKEELADLYYQRAKQLNKKGKRLDAIKSLEKTLEYNGRHEFAREEISTLYYTRALDLISANKKEEALAALDDTIKVKGDMIQAYVKRAEIQKALKNRDKAIEDYQKAYDMAKKKTDIEGPLMELYNEKLIKMEGTEDTGAIINTLSAMIRINPANTSLILRRGKLHLKGGNIGGAAGDFRVVLKIDPSNPEAIKLFSEIGYKEGMNQVNGNNFDGAIKTFQDILSVNPGNINAKIGLAEAYIGRGKFDDAKSLLDEAQSSQPNSPEAHLARGNLLEKQGKANEAKAEWEKAKSKAKPDSDTWNKANTKLGGK